MRNGEMPSPFSDVVCAAFAPLRIDHCLLLARSRKDPGSNWFRGNAQHRATSRQYVPANDTRAK